MAKRKNKGPVLPQLMPARDFENLIKTGERHEILSAAYIDNRIDRLPDYLYRYWQQVKRAYPILLEEPVTARARRRIKDMLNVDGRKANQIINDIKQIFPRLEPAVKEWDRQLDIHRVEKLIDKIENGVDTLIPILDENGNPTGETETKRIGGDIHSTSLPRLYKLLIMLKGTDSHEPAPPPVDFALPVPQFSTDINDLPGAVAEDIDHTEID